MTKPPANPLPELDRLPPMPRPDKPPVYFTFYSFKGGVGRSMALINCAAILAGRGFRVLAMDLDLEAPGISYFEAKGEVERQQPGFMDILHDALVLGDKAPFADGDPQQAIRHYIRSVPVPENLRAFDDGELYIMPAGKLDDQYESRRQEVDIARLYKTGRGQPLVKLLRQRIDNSRLFDFVLIDSRTGFSDEAGICIRDLGEHLVVLLSLNRQNAFGTARFLAQLKKTNVEPKSIDIVLSPVPVGEDELFNERRDEVAILLGEALGKEPDLDIELPYHPRLALIETPHISGRRHDFLHDAYHRLEQRLRERCGMAPRELYTQARTAIQQGKHEKAFPVLGQLLRLDRGLTVGLLWQAHQQHHKNAACEPYLQMLLRLSPQDADALGSYAAFLHEVRKDKERAEEFYKKAIEAEPNDATNLGNYAIFLAAVRRDKERAEEFHNRAIEAEPDNVRTLGSYALFLTDVREEHEGAEELYGRCIALDPDEANHKANYSKMLFALGRPDEASNQMHLAWEQADAAGVRLELCFYAYAHAAKPPPVQPLARLKALLQAGTRSPGWPLAANVERAVADGHTEPELLAVLARAIADEEPIEALDAFPVWQNTVPVE